MHGKYISVLSFLTDFKREETFSSGTIIKSVAIRQFKVCLSVLIFVWAVNHVKIDQLSQKLDVFFMKVTLVCTQKNCERMLDTFYRGITKS